MNNIQENIFNRNNIKQSINPDDLPNLSFDIPTNADALSNSKNEVFSKRLRGKEDLK